MTSLVGIGLFLIVVGVIATAFNVAVDIAEIVVKLGIAGLVVGLLILAYRSIR